MKPIFIQYILLILLFSCSSEKNNESEKVNKNRPSIAGVSDVEEEIPTIESLSDPLDKIRYSDTLKIQMEFPSCGEWGGHRESIILYGCNSNKIKAEIIIDTVDCDNIISKNGYSVLDEKTRETLIDTAKILNLNDEKIISIFLQRLLELYLKQTGSGNSSIYFEVVNTDSTLYIENSYGSSGCDTYVGKVNRKVFGDIFKEMRKRRKWKSKSDTIK